MLPFASSERRRTALRVLLTALAALFVGLPATGASASPHTLSAGDDLTCVVRDAGKLGCDAGRIVPGDAEEQYLRPTVPSEVSNAASVSVGRRAICVVRSDGRPACAGEGFSFGWTTEYGSFDATHGFHDLPSVGRVRQVAQGDQHGCVLKLDGSVWCWATDGRAGLLGDGSTPAPLPPFTPDPNDNPYGFVPWVAQGPAQASGIARAVDIAVGGAHHCAVLDSGSVRCWGVGQAGQLGSGTTAGSATPRTVVDLDDATSVGAGNAHTCALRANGRIACWGANDHGQLGNESRQSSSRPVPVVGVRDAVELAVGGDSACARLRSGSVVCWGRGDKGQLGDGGMTDRITAVVVDGIAGATQISVGTDHACAVGTGPAQCWGDGYSATAEPQRGVARDEQSIPPVTKVRGVSDARDLIGTDDGRTCALRDGGRLSCWGPWQDASGHIGNIVTPVDVTGLGPVRDIDLDFDGTLVCAVGEDGAVRCFDALASDGTPSLRSAGAGAALQPLPGISGAREVSLRYSYGCIGLDDGSVRCFDYPHTLPSIGSAEPVVGLSDASHLVLPGIYGPGQWLCAVTQRTHIRCLNVENPTAPVQVRDDDLHAPVTELTWDAADEELGVGGAFCWLVVPTGVAGDPGTSECDVAEPLSQIPFYAISLGSKVSNAVSLSTKHSTRFCRVDAEGQVRCGRQIPGVEGYIFQDYKIDELNDATRVATRGKGGCAILRDRTITCWGKGTHGELGDGLGPDGGHAVVLGKPVAADLTRHVRPAPRPIQISGGGRHSCATRPDGAARCWGLGKDGRLGNQKAETRAWPARVWQLAGATSVAAGDRHSCALLGDGSVRCWGFNLYGQLGDGTTKNAYRSVAVGGIADATGVAVGDRFSCALLESGKVSCWGLGSTGRLGNGGTASSSTPVSVSGLTDAVAVSARGSTACALRATTQVVCWGAGGEGRLGNGGTSTALAPVAVQGLTGVTQLSVGAAHACTRWIAGNGEAKVSCWGRGTAGQLGDGRSQSSSVPVLVSGLDSPSQVSAGGRKSCAIVAQGAVRCWGDDRLGDGTTNPSPTPVTVQGLTGVSEVSAGDEHTCAFRPTLAPVCWGRGVEGELGQDALDSSNVPVDVAGGARQIAR